jgi:vitamin B12 transporter
MNRRSSFAFSIFLSFVLAFPLLALSMPLAVTRAHGLDGDSTKTTYGGQYTLDEIVVSAEKPGVEAASTVREITSQDIERVNARTLDQALKLLPGILIRMGNEGTPRVDLRGFRSRHVLLLMDGVPLNSAYDEQFDPSLISTDNIEKIKLSYGDHSTLYGPGGLAGVINIITKRGYGKIEKTPAGVEGGLPGTGASTGKGMRGGASGKLRQEFGPNIDTNGRYSIYGADDKLDYFVAESQYKTTGFDLSKDFVATKVQSAGVRANSDIERNIGFAKFGYTASERVQVGLAVSTLTGSRGTPPNVIDSKTDPFASKVKYERHNDQDGQSAQFSIDYDHPGPWEFRSWFFKNRLEEAYEGYDDKTYTTQKAEKSFHQDSTTTVDGYAFQARCDIEASKTLSFALTTKNEGWLSSGFKMKKANKKDDLALDKELTQKSAAVEYEIAPSARSGMVFGLSANWFSSPEQDISANTFLIGGHYDPEPDTRIHASVASKVRFPSVDQLYDITSGNKNLTNEHSTNYELGIDRQLANNRTIGATAFLINVDNFIEVSDVTNLAENNDKYAFRGLELTADRLFGNGLYTRYGYTYLVSKDRSPGALRDELQYRPRDKFTVEADYTNRYGLKTDFTVFYLANQYYYSSDLTQKAKLNSIASANVKFTKKWTGKPIDLYLGVNNLLDKNYQESYGAPCQGRFIYSGLEYTF